MWVKRREGCIPQYTQERLSKTQVARQQGRQSDPGQQTGAEPPGRAGGVRCVGGDAKLGASDCLKAHVHYTISQLVTKNSALYKTRGKTEMPDHKVVLGTRRNLQHL